jgi:energy-coupling factor transport system ATP-binding protein
MIEFSDVTFKYNITDSEGTAKESCGVKDLNLKINDGEFVVLTGFSGCGKTTVIRLINGLIPKFYNGVLTGDIVLDGRNTKDMSIYDISQKVGSVFQNPRTQFFNVNTTDEIAFAAENQCIDPKIIKSKITDTANSMRINNLLDRNIFNLSGGEKQMVACAGINVLSPEIIVLDEPSSNLDHRAIKRLKSILEEWKEAGKTIVIAEHRLFFLKDLADRMIVMENGEIKKEFDKSQLSALTNEECEKMGLRSLSLADMSYSRESGKKDDNKDSNNQLEFKDFFFSYRDKKHSVSVPDLSISCGDVIAIIGHNGAGKSTLVRNICGLEKGSKGSIVYKGEKLGNNNRLRNCYMIMQDVNHQLFTESVLDEVMLSITDRKMSREEKTLRANEILDKLSLSEYANVHPMALSGGQKQRTAIASGIASSKPIIIFDEPTSGLDLNHMYRVADLIKELKQNGKTVLIITHDYEFILKCCDFVIHMDEGCVKDSYKIDNTSMEKLKKFIELK